MIEQVKNTGAVSDQPKATADVTWDEATFTWDQAAGTWDNPFAFAEQARNSAAIADQAKS